MDFMIHVTSNADMFAQAFNNVAMICNSPEFKIVKNICIAIGLFMTTLAYVKGKDVMVYAKWIAIYMFVVVGLLGINTTCWISATTNPTMPPQKVDNVPIGMSLPAYVFTTIGTGLTQLFEEVFAEPGDQTYSKTGMLFGSNLFRMSLGSEFADPLVQDTLNDYVAQCVIPDILVSHKYTYKSLMNSNYIWTTITTNPSQIRGIYVDDDGSRVFKTCQQSVAFIQQQIETSLKNTDSQSPFGILRNKISQTNSIAGRDISSDLEAAYSNNINDTSKQAVDILKQNLLINGMRNGIKSYATSLNNTAAMQNISNTTAMLKQRMSWSTSYHIGTYDLPILQTILLLLAFCSFPIVVALCLIPSLSINVFKNYIFGIVWLESWPLFYSILNFAITFYSGSTKYADAPTLLNINQLAQQQSDLAGMAGYLILAIPFISTFVVKGMANTLASTAQYIGSLAHSNAQSSAAMAVSGNYSFGNVSMSNASMNNQTFDNINAHKHDTNYTDFYGNQTYLASNGSQITRTRDGSLIFNDSTGMSALGIDASVTKSMAESHMHSAQQMMSTAMNETQSFNKNFGNTAISGDSYSKGGHYSFSKDASTVANMVDRYAKDHSMSDTQAYSTLMHKDLNVSVGVEGSAGLKFLGDGAVVKTSASASEGVSDQQQHTSDDRNTNSHSLSNDKIKSFREAANRLEQYAQNHQYSTNNTEAENAASAIASNYTKSYQESQTAQYISNHSEQIRSNMSQQIEENVRAKYGDERAVEILSATSGPLFEEKQQIISEAMQEYQPSQNFTLPQEMRSHEMENFRQHNDSMVAGQAQPLTHSVHSAVNNDQSKSEYNHIKASEDKKLDGNHEDKKIFVHDLVGA